MNGQKGLLLGLIPLLILLMRPPVIVRAAESSGRSEPPLQVVNPSPAEDLGYGVGSVVASLLYSPLKVTYAGLGLLTGGLGFVLSAGRADVADNIIYPAVTGNYLITPRHLKGEQPVVFIGSPGPGNSQPQDVASGAPAPRH
ncbi:MAG: hypothetical protein ACE5HC_14900 [Candidatus Binatia bacterium]